jgi:hypothetical protein
VGDTVENPEDQQDGPFLIDRFRSALSSFYLIRPFFVSSGIYLSSLRRNTCISLSSDAPGDISPSLLSILQLPRFLIPLDSGTFNSCFLISRNISSAFFGCRTEGLDDLLTVMFSPVSVTLIQRCGGQV